jgi:hypothetical protein
MKMPSVMNQMNGLDERLSRSAYSLTYDEDEDDYSDSFERSAESLTK